MAHAEVRSQHLIGVLPTECSFPELIGPQRRCQFQFTHGQFPYTHTRFQSTHAQSSSKGGARKGVIWALGLSLFGAAAYMTGALYPPELLALLVARSAPPPFPPHSPEAQKNAAEIEALLANLPHVQALLRSASPVLPPPPSKLPALPTPAPENPATTVDASSDAMKSHYVISRPFANLPPSMLPHSLTAGSLRKPGMLAVPPLVLSKTRHGAQALGGAQGDAYAFLHLGRSLCGHDGIVHGGLLATILDESLARTSFFHLPHKIGMTAKLEINYKYPVKADQVVVVETRTVDAKGRKVHVEGEIRDLSGRLLVQSKALFVEPKHVQWLDTSAVRHVMDSSDE